MSSPELSNRDLYMLLRPSESEIQRANDTLNTVIETDPESVTELTRLAMLLQGVSSSISDLIYASGEIDVDRPRIKRYSPINPQGPSDGRLFSATPSSGRGSYIEIAHKFPDADILINQLDIFIPTDQTLDELLSTDPVLWVETFHFARDKNLVGNISPFNFLKYYPGIIQDYLGVLQPLTEEFLAVCNQK